MISKLFRLYGTLVVIYLIFPVARLAAQSTETRGLELKRLEQRSQENEVQRSLRVKAYAEKHQVPTRYRDGNGNLVLMIDVVNDSPYYITTDNEGAAITTGVPALRQGGALGLDLQGEGMFVGVWDGGSVTHSEFIERVNGGQGTDDSHANHVTGTISATGNNPTAKGMAPKVNIYSFDFGSDVSEMLTLARPDQTSLLLSNHSYGLITGWYFNGTSWEWRGVAGVSTTEDYRFGFYSPPARQWDEIAFNAPYYTMMKSAGNDRNNTGTGTFPPDCNGGAGYDCISDVSVAKNIITVGAVSKVSAYTSPSSVQMSSFSSWGPTDDGRIKPDIVAAGVNLFSTTAGNTYGSLSGTSMATPNATGSLILLQELHKNLHEGNFMRSATLKALAIHTAKEAGSNPGPDYKFGWGLLDVAEGARVLLNEDDNNIRIEELTLANGQIYELELMPVANKKIKATIVWTDPPGTPVAASLDPTNIMLVNDLDIRIIDDANNDQLPWVLNPADPDASAIPGDNIRDNVEKIEFESPDPRKYKLVVSHKGVLSGGEQDFSLILEYTATDDPRSIYYWVGGSSGNWNNPALWSSSSGGPTINSVPGVNDRVFIDENSFENEDQTISLTSDFSCGSLTWLSDKSGILDLNGNTLTITGDVFVKSPSLTLSTAGTLNFAAPSGSTVKVDFGGSDLSGGDILFDGDNVSWELIGLAGAKGIKLIEGNLDASDLICTLTGVDASGVSNRQLDIRNSHFSGLEEINLSGSNLELLSSGLVFELSQINHSTVQIDKVINGQVIVNPAGASISGMGNYSEIIVNGNVEILESITIDDLVVNAGSVISVESGKQIELTPNTTFESTSGNEISIVVQGGSKAFLLINEYVKLCFDNLIVIGIDVNGNAIVNAGTNSQITNSANWIEDVCDNVLFPKFTWDYPCVGSLTQFTNESSGAIETRSWNFGDPESGSNESSLESPWHSYSAVGSYTVSLTVNGSENEKTFGQEIQVVANDLGVNHVILSNEKLYSFNEATAYQWYWNNELIEGATQRGYDFEDKSGSFFVVTYGQNCNRISSTYIVTSLPEDPTALHEAILLYPNPTNDRLTVEVPADQTLTSVTIYDFVGRKIIDTQPTGSQLTLSTLSFEPGVYIVRVATNKFQVTRKVLVRR